MTVFYLRSNKKSVSSQKKCKMNLSKSAFRRYKVIDELVRNPRRKYPKMNEIIDACWEKLDFMPSKETIQKDIANMRLPYPDGFDAPIRWCPTNRGYEYTDPNYALAGVSLRQEELDIITEAVDFIQSLGGTRISHQFNNAVEKLVSATKERKLSTELKRPILQTMVPPVSRGFEHFDLFYQACKERLVVSFVHFSYRKRMFKHCVVHPFLIKEFENRWYLIGYSESHDAIRIFGFDRISEPFLTNKPFKKMETAQMDIYLNDVYGVYPIAGAKKEKIQIEVNRENTQYFQAYPLHESQQIQKHNHGNSTITFELIPSYELARYFLAQGRNVRITSPKWLSDFTNELSHENR